MRPAPYDFDIYQDRTLRVGFTIYEKIYDVLTDTWVRGNPFDLTDYTARLVVPAGAEEDFIHLTTPDEDSFPEGSHILLGGVLGTVEWYIPDEATADLELAARNEYHFDLQTPTGDWLPWTRGECRYRKVR